MKDVRLDELNKRAKELSNKGNIEDSVRVLKIILDYNPFYFKANFNLGVIYQQQGKLLESIDYYKNALISSSNDRNCVINLAYSYFGLNMFKEARAIVRIFLDQFGDDAEMLSLLDQIEIKCSSDKLFISAKEMVNRDNI